MPVPGEDLLIENRQAEYIERLQAEVERHRKIKCPDNPGGRHRWNGDGQCLDCCNYATDLIDSTLPTKESGPISTAELHSYGLRLEDRRPSEEIIRELRAEADTDEGE